MQEPNFKSIINNISDGLYLVDINRVITFWNKTAERITGYAAEEVVGKSCADNILTHIDSEGNALCTGLCPLAETIADGNNREAEIYLHHKDGHRIPVLVRITAITDKNGKISGGIELFSDISNRASNDLRIKELEKMAFLDHLTQMANRHYLQRELEIRFEEFKRYDLPFGILLIDIDRFKKFNDKYGHDLGDILLKAVAKTCVNNSRPFDLYGRWGGEEFIGIIRNVNHSNLKFIANRLRFLIENTYVFYNEEKIQVTVSIGATLAQADDNADSIIKRADNLLYISKNRGRNRATVG